MTKFLLFCVATACVIFSIIAEAEAAPLTDEDATLAALSQAILQLANSLKEAGQTQMAEQVAAAAEAAETGVLPEDLNTADIASTRRGLKFDDLSPDDQTLMKNLAKTVKQLAATLISEKVAEDLNIDI